MFDRSATVLVALLLAAVVSACGQKGPLSLPSERDAQQQTSR
jgi:predicted small lipoprotein YifL